VNAGLWYDEWGMPYYVDSAERWPTWDLLGGGFGGDMGSWWDWPAGLEYPIPGGGETGEGVIWEEVDQYVAQVLSRLIGVAPRGEFQKFARTIYPRMAAQAAATGQKVYAFWFGDAIVVNPDGSWSVAEHPETLTAFMEFIAGQAKVRILYVLDCGAGPETGTCHFDKYGSANILDEILKTPQPTEMGLGTVGLLIGIAIVGGVAIFAASRR